MTIKYPDNYGLVWENGHLLKLEHLMKQGKTIEEVSRILGRTKLSCENMYREIRRMDMMRHGGPLDNLRTWDKQNVGH